MNGRQTWLPLLALALQGVVRVSVAWLTDRREKRRAEQEAIRRRLEVEESTVGGPD